MLAGYGCGAPGVPDAGTVSSFLRLQISTPLRGPGGGCRQGPDHLTMAEPEGKAEQHGGAPWYKTQAVVSLRQRLEAPRNKYRAVITRKLRIETFQYKT